MRIWLEKTGERYDTPVPGLALRRRKCASGSCAGGNGRWLGLDGKTDGYISVTDVDQVLHITPPTIISALGEPTGANMRR